TAIYLAPQDRASCQSKGMAPRSPVARTRKAAAASKQSHRHRRHDRYAGKHVVRLRMQSARRACSDPSFGETVALGSTVGSVRVIRVLGLRLPFFLCLLRPWGPSPERAPTTPTRRCGAGLDRRYRSDAGVCGWERGVGDFKLPTNGTGTATRNLTGR